MLVLLSAALSFLGTLLTAIITAPIMRYIFKAILLGLAIAAITALFLNLYTLVDTAGETAISYMWSEFGTNMYISSTMAWVQCVTPASMSAAITVVAGIYVAVLVVRLTKWVVMMQLSG